MSFSLRRLDIVSDDLIAAGLWYEEQNPGAGLPRALVEEADVVTLSLAAHALHHRLRFRDVRRAPLKRFGFYAIYYVVRKSTAIVIAVFHDRRAPRRIRQRRREIAISFEAKRSVDGRRRALLQARVYENPSLHRPRSRCKFRLFLHRIARTARPV